MQKPFQPKKGIYLLIPLSQHGSSWVTAFPAGNPGDKITWHFFGEEPVFWALKVGVTEAASFWGKKKEESTLRKVC